MLSRIGLVVVLVGAVASGRAQAQAKLVPLDAPKPVDTTTVIQGWNPFLALTSTFNLVSNSNVIGQVDGVSTVFGLGLLGGAEYIQAKHFFQGSLTVNEAFSRTPVVDRWVKSNDAVKLEGLYNYFINAHAGAYGRLSLATAFFPSYDVRGTPTSWVDATGPMPVPLATGVLSQHLAGKFQPFTVSESAGGFADPIRREELALSVRVGFGGRSTFADDVLVNHDASTTPEVELLRLSDVHQLGLEGFAGAVGKLQKGKFNYKAGFAVLLPFVNNDAASRSATFLTRLGFDATLTYAMSTWLSIVYSATVTRDPQLFPDGKDEVQFQNTVLLTFQLNLVQKKEPPKAKTKEQLQLEDAIQRAEEAEKKWQEAEKKLKEMGPSPNDTTTPTTDPPSPPPVNPQP